MPNGKTRKKDSARLVWDSKPRRAPNPRDIEFQTAELVIPNPQRDAGTLPLFPRGFDRLIVEPDELPLGGTEIDKRQMNRLIWGDNLLAMQALLAHGYEGKINLIYIDPPFDSKADYSHRLTIDPTPGVSGDEVEITKEPSVIERLAYKDTWAGGLDSYLDMLYPRLQLMKRLLAENGSIYVHAGPNISHYVKVMLDEIFGAENCRNEIVWQRFNFHADANRFGIVHDYILFYSKSDRITWNPIRRPLDPAYIKSHFTQVDEEGRVYTLDNPLAKGDGPPRRFGDKVLPPPKGTHWRWGQDMIDKLMAEGRIVFTKSGRPRVKRYLDEIEGAVVHSIWTDIPAVNSQALEDTRFDTQKPEALLERIIKASSNEGDLVADFFCGSGTTLLVAERLGRRWVGVELGKVGVQVTRQRLVTLGMEWDRKTHSWKGEPTCKPFLIENIGNYQREMIYLSGGRIHEMQRVILKLYGAEPRRDSQDLGVRKSPDDGTLELVYVGYPDRAVTARKVEELARQAAKLDGAGYRRLVVLAWDYDYNFDEEWEARRRAMKTPLNIEVIKRMIPPDIYDYLKRAKDEGDIEPLREKVRFNEKPYLRLMKPKVEKLSKDTARVTVGIERYVLFDLPVREEKEREKLMQLVKNNFAALIDYWAVDWNYDGVTFKSQWQDFRGNGKRTRVVSTTAEAELPAGQERTIAIRVVDVFGNDATGTVEVKL